MSIYLSIVIIIVCVCGEAFFSGSEIAIVSVDKLRLKHAAKKGHRPSRLLLESQKRPEWILGVTLLGTNVSTITGTTVASYQLYLLMGPAGIPVAIVVMSFINWIFAEIVPKSVFQQMSDSVATKIIYILRFFSVLFFPIVWIFSRIAGLLSTLIGGSKSAKKGQFISKEELGLLMKMTEHKGDVKPSEKKMINRLLSFTETEAQDIMVPLIEVAALSDKSKVSDAIATFVSTKHRRIPVYSDRIDRIVGILNSFDILGEDENRKIIPFIRKAFYIPPKMSVSDLLERLQSTGHNMAIVIDEFGGSEGIVTIEDILEEVVGEIEDEYDDSTPRYKVQDDKSVIVDGRMETDEINERFGTEIPEGDYETIGGFIINILKRIPKSGETINVKNSVLTVKKATDRLVKEVKIERKINQ